MPGIGRSILASAPTSEGALLTMIIEVAVTIVAIAFFRTHLSKGGALISKKAVASKGVANSIRQLPGIGGLALSLALQTTLSNFIGGGVLMPKDGVQRLGKRSSSEQ